MVLSSEEIRGAPRRAPLPAGWSRQAIAFLLLHVYVFLLTLGMLQRPFGDPFGFGISSILSIAIIALLLRETILSIRAHLMLLMWLTLLAYVFAITLSTFPDRPLLTREYMRILGLLANLLLCAAVASLPWNAIKTRSIGISMTAGLFIVGVLAVIDDAGMMNLAPINVSLINDPPIREPVAQFGHRSIMSLYLAVMLSFLFVLEDQSPRQSVWLRSVLIAVGVCFLYFLIYSKNRSGVAAIAIAMATYYAFNLRHGDRWLHPRIPGFVLTVILALLVVFWFRAPQAMTFFSLWANSPFSEILRFIPNPLGHQWANIAELADTKMNPFQKRNLYESDMLRVHIVKETFAGLRENILGRGFMTNTHVHFVIDIIHAAGVVGILWLVAFAYYVAGMIRSIVRSGMERAALWLLLTPLIAWIFVGLMFNAINLGLGWVFFGMMLARHRAVRA